ESPPRVVHFLPGPSRNQKSGPPKWEARCSGYPTFQLLHRPKPFEGGTVRAFPELLECAIPDLTNPLAGHTEQHPDLLQRPLLALVQPVVEVEDLSLALGEVLLEHPLEELAASLRLDLLLDLFRFRTGETLTERG